MIDVVSGHIRGTRNDKTEAEMVKELYQDLLAKIKDHKPSQGTRKDYSKITRKVFS